MGILNFISQRVYSGSFSVTSKTSTRWHQTLRGLLRISPLLFFIGSRFIGTLIKTKIKQAFYMIPSCKTAMNTLNFCIDYCFHVGHREIYLDPTIKLKFCEISAHAAKSTKKAKGYGEVNSLFYRLNYNDHSRVQVHQLFIKTFGWTVEVDLDVEYNLPRDKRKRSVEHLTLVYDKKSFLIKKLKISRNLYPMPKSSTWNLGACEAVKNFFQSCFGLDVTLFSLLVGEDIKHKIIKTHGGSETSRIDHTSRDDVLALFKKNFSEESKLDVKSVLIMPKENHVETESVVDEDIVSNGEKYRVARNSKQYLFLNESHKIRELVTTCSHEVVGLLADY